MNKHTHNGLKQILVWWFFCCCCCRFCVWLLINGNVLEIDVVKVDTTNYRVEMIRRDHRFELDLICEAASVWGWTKKNCRSSCKFIVYLMSLVFVFYLNSTSAVLLLMWQMFVVIVDFSVVLKMNHSIEMYLLMPCRICVCVWERVYEQWIRKLFLFFLYFLEL